MNRHLLPLVAALLAAALTTGLAAAHGDFREGHPSSPVYLAASGNLPGELELFYRVGVDGVFTDNLDVAVATRTELAEVPRAH